jgi:hypothetical protein
MYFFLLAIFILLLYDITWLDSVPENLKVCATTSYICKFTKKYLGCRVCRRRRVKCDERHPACKRCQDAGIECEGYVRDHRFVDEVARTVRHAQKASSKSKSHARDRTSPKTQGIKPEMSLVGVQDNITISFLLSNILSGMARSSWMEDVAEDTKSATSQNSILALSKVYFGRINKRQDVMRQGVVLYGQALRSLRRDLQDEEKAWSLSVLTSSMTLQLYELIATSSESGWLQHASGIGRLIELRGPGRHQSRAERRILENNRATIALGCVVKRQRCVLEHPDWKTIPSSSETIYEKRQSTTSALHDIMMDIGGLMEDADLLQNSNFELDQFLLQKSALLDNIRAHLNDLYAWRIRWEV